MISERWQPVVNVGGAPIPQYAVCELRPSALGHPDVPGVRLAQTGATGALGVAPVALAPGARGYVQLRDASPILTVGPVTAGDTLQPSATAGYAEVGTAAPFVTVSTVAPDGTVTALLVGAGVRLRLPDDVPQPGDVPWTDYTPTVTQQDALTLSSVQYCRYKVLDHLVTLEGNVTVGSAGSTAWPILIGGLPSTLVARDEVLRVVGVGQYQNASVNWVGGLAWEPPSPGTLAIRRDSSPTGTGFTGRAYVGKDPSPGFAVSAGDILLWSGQWPVV